MANDDQRNQSHKPLANISLTSLSKSIFAGTFEKSIKCLIFLGTLQPRENKTHTELLCKNTCIICLQKSQNHRVVLYWKIFGKVKNQNKRDFEICLQLKLRMRKKFKFGASSQQFSKSKIENNKSKIHTCYFPLFHQDIEFIRLCTNPK